MSIISSPYCEVEWIKRGNGSGIWRVGRCVEARRRECHLLPERLRFNVNVNLNFGDIIVMGIVYPRKYLFMFMEYFFR